VLGFPDYDAVGINGMARWEKQLDGMVADFKVYNYAGMFQMMGNQSMSNTHWPLLFYLS
jgi:hypothetical protein